MLSPALLRLAAQTLRYCATLDLGFDIPLDADIPDEDLARMDEAFRRAASKSGEGFGAGHDAVDSEVATALARIFEDEALAEETLDA